MLESVGNNIYWTISKVVFTHTSPLPWVRGSFHVFHTNTNVKQTIKETKVMCTELGARIGQIVW